LKKRLCTGIILGSGCSYGARPNPLGELTALPDPLAGFRGRGFMEGHKGKEVAEREGLPACSVYPPPILALPYCHHPCNFHGPW